MDNLNFEFTKLKPIEIKELLSFLKGYTIQYKNNLGLPNDLTFGVEIEFNNVTINTILRKLKINNIDLKYVKKYENHYNEWVIERDITIEKSIYYFFLSGGEIISPILTDNPNHWNDINLILKKLKKLRAKSIDCGGHIHMKYQDVSTNNDLYLLFLKIWCIYEKEIYRFCNKKDFINSKRFRLYCSTITNIDNMIALSNGDYSFTCDDKSNGISLSEINDTIEFRVPDASLDAVTWQNNINLFSKILVAIKNSSIDVELIEDKFKNLRTFPNYQYLNYDMKTAFEFIDLIFDNTEDKINYLKQYFHDNKKVYDDILKKKVLY